MKTLLLSISICLLVAACGSGTSVSDSPPTDISGNYRGSYESSNGRDTGTLSLNIAQNANTTTTGTGDNATTTTENALTGTIIVDFVAGRDPCILNSTVMGTINGFNVSLTGSKTQQVETINETISETTDANGNVTKVTIDPEEMTATTTVTDSEGNVTSTRVAPLTITTDAVTRIINMQLTADGRSLRGTYTISGDNCSNSSSSGSIELTR